MNRNEKGQFEQKYHLDEYGDLYDLYGGWVTTNAEKTTTIDRLKAGVRAWLHWCENYDRRDVDPPNASENDVRAYIQWCQGQGFADTTISRRVASVSKYYHHLKLDVEADWNLERNPVAFINLREDYKIKNQSDYVRVLDREGREDIIAVDPGSIKKLVQHVPGERPETRTRNELIIRLLWQTACRADELSRIREGNVDMKSREIKIRSSKLNRVDHPDLYNRRLWWEPNLDMLLSRWLNSHRSKLSKYAEAKEAEDDDDDGWDASSYLFVTTHGPQIDPKTVSRVVKRAAHNAGIQEPLVRAPDGSVERWLYTGHRLRHSRITHLANDVNNGEGMDLDALRRMAGHARFDTTLDYVQSNWQVARERFRSATRNSSLGV